MIVNNCRIKYGSATQKNKFDDSRISIDFFVDDKKEEKALREAIADVKDSITGKAKVQHIGCKKYKGKEKGDKDEGRWLFKTWTYAKQFESDLDAVIPMVKENGAEYALDKRPNLSWGSIVNISLTPKEWSTPNGSDKGVKLILRKVQVVNAIEYEGGDEFGAVEGHGFEDEPKKKKKGKKKKKD